MNCMTKELELNGRNGEGFKPFQVRLWWRRMQIVGR